MPRLVTTVLVVEDAASPATPERVKEALASSDGVLSASFNAASRLATVLHDPEVAPAEGLIARIELAGCRAHRPAASDAGAAERAEPPASEAGAFGLGAVLSLLVLAAGLLPRADLAQALMLVLAIPAVVFLAAPMISRSIRDLGEIHDGLSAGAAVVVFAMSVVGQVLGADRVYFDSAVLMLTVTALGRYAEQVLARRAAQPILALETAIPETARVSGEGGLREVLWEEVTAGQAVVVRPGEQVPVDGVVTQGSSSVDEGVLLGITEPRLLRQGSLVYAGTRNIEGILTVYAEATGALTVWARRVSEALRAASQRSQVECFARRVGGMFGLSVLAAAAATAAAWSIVPVAGLAMDRIVIAAASVLAAAAPAGVVSAAGVALRAALGRLSEFGIAVRTPDAFDAGAQVSAVVFGKTSTVTEGEPQVVETVTIADGTEAEIIGLAAGVERGSHHPLAKAVMSAAAARSLAIERPRNPEEVPGEGASGDLSEGRVYVGTAHFLESKGVDLKGLPAEAGKLERQGLTCFFVAKGDKALGLVAVADLVREDAREAVTRLKGMGLRVTLLSGDSFRTTMAVAEKLGFQSISAALKPEEKVFEVRSMGSGNRGVAFVGGSADAAEAMAASTLGVGVGPDSWGLPGFAQVLLPSGRLLGVPRFLAIARRAMDTVRQNVFLGLAVSASAMVLTAILGVRAAPSDAHVALVPVVAACVAALSRAFSAARGEALARFDVDAPAPPAGGA